MCWFEQGLTDSYGAYDPGLHPLQCLGFIRGSNCPHYDSEPNRRLAFQQCVQAGDLLEGYGCDDDIGLHFVEESLTKVVSARVEACAYRVQRGPSGPEEVMLRSEILK